ncbi:MAG: NAD(P)H-hydrate dehydratase [Desulfovibrio sp.]
MFSPAPTPTKMHEWDTIAINKYKIPGRVLMENACREAFAVLAATYSKHSSASTDASKFAYPPYDTCKIFAGKSICILAGSGNNGGDGFGLARYLHDAGAAVAIYHTAPLNTYKAETAANMRLARQLGIPLHRLSKTKTIEFHKADIIIDALLGTGFSGELREATLHYVRSVNTIADRLFVFSLDIPSGLNGLTGLPQPEAITAHATVTFENAKIGLLQPSATQYTGELHARAIGIPEAVKQEAPCDQHLITPEILRAATTTDSEMHKGTAGRVLIIGGSDSMAGAPSLAARGALRAGCGVVTTIVPKKVQPVTAQFLPEMMTAPAGTDAFWTEECVASVTPHLHNVQAVVIGPGMGREKEAEEFLRALLPALPKGLPKIIDADALFHLSNMPDELQKLDANTILTPHPGEMAMLAKESITKVQNNRLTTARKFCDSFSGILALKGAGTIVQYKQKGYICSEVAANLATAGSGDVLTGVIASLLARKTPPLTATCAAVFWHAKAGQHIHASFPDRGNLASDIADVLPIVIKETIHD